MRPNHSVEGHLLTSVDTRQALGRVAASETFAEAENLRRLLLYLGEATLEGRADQLKEYTVGVEALGRPERYEPRLDSSARMLAGRLRRKLEDYYRGEGSADPVRISFPKGGFKLSFEAVESATVHKTVPASDLVHWRRLTIALAAALLIAVVYIAVSRIRSTAPPSFAVEMGPDLEALWQPILDGHTPVVVSFGSPLFVGMGGWSIRRYDLNDWSAVEADAPLGQLERLMRLGRKVPNYNYAGIGDVNGAFLIAKLLGSRIPQLTLKRGAVLSLEDIQNNHLVFIGNGKNQEKLRYLLERLEFSLDAQGVFCHAPRAGEPARYANSSGTAKDGKADYGLISVLPGSRKGRYMMILSANDTAAIWGVTEAVTNPRFAEPLVSRLRSHGRLPKAFQAVVRVRLNADVPVAMDYVVHHEIPADRATLD